MPKIDVTSLEAAASQLDSVLQEFVRQPESEFVRDGAIKRFEYTHELAVKFIRRALQTFFDDAVDEMSYNDVLRTAAERGLIDDVQAWFDYRTARNKSSHTYDARIAVEVFLSAQPFLEHARYLLRRLHELND